MYLCIDPGVDYFAWAYGSKDQLLQCGVTKRATDQGVFMSFLGTLLCDITDIEECWIEIPKIRHRKNINHNDILNLALSAGIIYGYFWRSHCTYVSMVTPEYWKGTVPKKIHQPRVLSRLIKKELVILEKTKTKRQKKIDHNIIDAVGILLWVQERLKP